MNLTDKPNMAVLETVRNLPRLIYGDIQQIGNNIIYFCRMDETWNRIEQNLRSVSVQDIACSDCIYVSNMVVYSKPLEAIWDKYGSLDFFWDFVMKNVDTSVACMFLHEDNTMPHVHLILKFDKAVRLEDVASSLDEIYINKTGQSEVKTHTVDYLFCNLYDSYSYALQCDRSHGEEATSMVVKITPAFAEYLIKYENMRINTAYKEYLRKEQDKYEER